MIRKSFILLDFINSFYKIDTKVSIPLNFYKIDFNKWLVPYSRDTMHTMSSIDIQTQHNHYKHLFTKQFHNIACDILQHVENTYPNDTKLRSYIERFDAIYQEEFDRYRYVQDVVLLASKVEFESKLNNALQSNQLLVQTIETLKKEDGEV